MWWPNVLLLLSAQLGSALQNLADYHLVCVNDYVYTIDCTLRVAPGPDPQPLDASYWLTFSSTDPNERVVACLSPERTADDCTLVNAGGDNYSCSFTSPNDYSFDTSTDFRIDLCLGMNHAVLLDEEYAPRYNITPLAPSNLEVELNTNLSQVIFSWKSSYDKYLPNFYLHEYLKYELQMDRDGHTERTLSLFKLTTFMADLSSLAAGQYVARVRSAPDGSDYLGHWSQWSQEFRFRIPGAQDGTGLVGLDIRLIVGLCFLVPACLLLCFLPILSRWRKHTFIPTPVLHFSPLTDNYKGEKASPTHISSPAKHTQNNPYSADVLTTNESVWWKSWAPSVAPGLAQSENTAQIDVLTKCPDYDCKAWLLQDPAGERAAPCSEVQEPAPEVSYPCVPYAVTPVRGDDKKMVVWEPDGGLCDAGPLDGNQQGLCRKAYCSLSDEQCALEQRSSAGGGGGGGGARLADDQGFPAGKVALDYQNCPHLRGTH